MSNPGVFGAFLRSIFLPEDGKPQSSGLPRKPDPENSSAVFKSDSFPRDERLKEYSHQAIGFDRRHDRAGRMQLKVKVESPGIWAITRDSYHFADAPNRESDLGGFWSRPDWLQHFQPESFNFQLHRSD